MSNTPLRIGIVANEFFDASIGRVGGFGWAARKAADVFVNHSACNAKVFFLTAEELDTDRSGSTELEGIPLISLYGNRLSNIAKLLPKKIDVLLTIDYRTTYRGVFNALPFTPIITWVRDPRSSRDIEKVMSLKIPGKEYTIPAGIGDTNTKELSMYKDRPFPFLNSVTLSNKMPYMKKTNEAVYGMPSSNAVLPNPSVVDYGSVRVQKSENPTVLFLGRLDPIKRPWLFIELARNFPDVSFLMLGENHFSIEESWEIDNVPENLKLLGHVTGLQKFEILSSAWVLVNTSIHEQSPVSVMEALAYETAVLSYEDWGGLVGRHGMAIGQHTGTGMAGLPDLTNALQFLLSNNEKRKYFGRAGRQYVEKEHNDEAFLAAFRDICLAAGVTKVRDAIKFDTGEFS